MAQQSKAESFSAYLGAWEKSKSSAADASGSRLALLQVLAAADQKQMAVNDLLTASGMGITDFAENLKNLEQSGYLTRSGSASAEIVKLTPLGEDVSRLAGSK
jgi:DNA-binding MarR family transcriptional regulator